ncbi:MULTISPECIES: hypothetical protein [unclassified Brucella]|uniref:hypothetical protein n=1 Tax=unclassified Brucella TaxID=2632610 RepID=UPI000972D5ED|nr:MULTISPECIES: hypothetical protein [unclassified Brucella]APX70547.1 hypothetical protein BKD03_15445 [Brucella sp. 09RB8471]MRN79878.1 hypothetical protein [Brucella sp. 10RB9210]
MTRIYYTLDGGTVAGYEPLPEGARKITEAQYQALLANPQGGEIPSLADIKRQLAKQVDAAAESERLNYITPGNGQAMTYQQKVAEAQAFKVAINPQPVDYPTLSSEVGITADTLDEIANIVLSAFAQWQQIGGMIEGIRLGAKRDIDAAQDEATARAIVDAIVWPSAQVQP